MNLSVLDGFSSRVSEAINGIPAIDPGHIGIGLSSFGAALLLAYAEKRWWPTIAEKWGAYQFAKRELRRKLQRTKEAMDNREVRLQQMIGEILVDGLLERGVRGELSLQEEKKLLKELGHKLGLKDLLTPCDKLRIDALKKEILARFHQREYGYSLNGAQVEEILRANRERRKTPPPLPPEAQVVTTVASTNKYWKPKPVAA